VNCSRYHRHGRSDRSELAEALPLTMRSLDGITAALAPLVPDGDRSAGLAELLHCLFDLTISATVSQCHGVTYRKKNVTLDTLAPERPCLQPIQ